MPIKICFNNQIHRFAKLPVDLKALISSITSTFNQQLPQSWSLYYIDSEGDQVTISHEEDYKSLLDSEAKNSSSAIKVFVTPNSQTSLPVQSHGGPEKSKDLAQEKQKQKQETVKQSSQNIREKTACADNPVIEDHKLNEVQPRAYPQPYDEGFKNIHKVKKILFKLSMMDLPEEEKARLSEKLKKIEESLTPEQKARLEEKKVLWTQNVEKWERKGGWSRSRSRCHSRGDSKEKGGYKLKHLYRKLAQSDLSEEKRARITEKVKEIEASLTPEQKAEFEQKKEKWQRKAAMMEELFKHKRGPSPTADFEFKIDEQGRPIHSNVACDNCKTMPITGIRYKCAICHDFNFCEACEANVDHPHPLFKIKSPVMAMMLWKQKFGHEGKHGTNHGRGPFGGHHHEGRGPFEGRPNKDSFKIFKLFKKLNKLQEAVQIGDAEKVKKIQEKLNKKLPEEANRILKQVFKLATENADQETLRQTVEKAKEQLIGFFHPEDKEQVVRQWNHFKEMRQKHQEFKREFHGSQEGGMHHRKLWKFSPAYKP